MGADYLFHVKSIATFALTFFVYIISVLASVPHSTALWSQDSAQYCSMSGRVKDKIGGVMLGEELVLINIRNYRAV